MHLAIADPPYLGRAARYYGPGVNGTAVFDHTAGGRGQSGRRRPSLLRTTEHADAATWDDPATHLALVDQLEASCDGWALAAAADTLAAILPAAPTATIAAWVKPNAVPGGARIIAAWEPVLIRVPPGRNLRARGLAVRNVLTCPAPNAGHIGAKPRAWTRWILDLLGYDPALDTVLDLFPGSGAVAAELAQTVLDVTDNR